MLFHIIYSPLLSLLKMNLILPLSKTSLLPILLVVPPLLLLRKNLPRKRPRLKLLPLLLLLPLNPRLLLPLLMVVSNTACIFYIFFLLSRFPIFIGRVLASPLARVSHRENLKSYSRAINLTVFSIDLIETRRRTWS